VPLNRWNDKFSRTTRGRILSLLRRSARTVDELATDLKVTDNAVRAQLTTLERDGLVRPSGLRRSGAGKPPQVYGLAAEAERLFFSSACAPFLAQFLDAASARLEAGELKALMRSVGQGLAAAQTPLAGDARARVEAASRLLDDLGGMTEVQAGNGGLVIRGHICPVGALAQQHPEVCEAIESFVASVTGMAVRQHCGRIADQPRCNLHVMLPAKSRSRTARPR
jgi:predicted ArsR family transcriptional regulator